MSAPVYPATCRVEQPRNASGDVRDEGTIQQHIAEGATGLRKERTGMARGTVQQTWTVTLLPSADGI